MNRGLGSLIVLLAFSAVSCGSSGGTAAYAESQERLRIEVTVTHRENAMLPPNSTVRAALFDETHELRPAISSNAVTAREGRGVPVELVITYPIDQIDDSHDYVVRGEITDPNGKLLFATDEPVPIEPDQEEPQKVELVLRPAP